MHPIGLMDRHIPTDDYQHRRVVCACVRIATGATSTSRRSCTAPYRAHDGRARRVRHGACDQCTHQCAHALRCGVCVDRCADCRTCSERVGCRRLVSISKCPHTLPYSFNAGFIHSIMHKRPLRESLQFASDCARSSLMSHQTVARDLARCLECEG